MGPPANSSLARWSTPECPFTLEYAPQVLDDIRLAVVDAFFSLPRGGAEIGGILLGRSAPGRVVITDAIPLDCEHAFGPSFTLSEGDQAQLGVKLAEAAKTPNSKPVGWYHSHTRSEIFFSEADLEIHKRFFREPWQVALVLKPHTFLPTRAGVFFQEKDGAMRADASYQEIQLDPLPIGKVPAEEPAARPAPATAPAQPGGRVIDISRVAKLEPAPEAASRAQPEPELEPQPVVAAASPVVPTPNFGMDELSGARRWIAPVAILAGLAVGAAGFLTRQLWMPRPAAVATAGIVAQASVGLTAADRDGHLQIHWDTKAPDLQHSTGAMLLISDGPLTRSIALDTTQLRSGSYSYKRNSDRVDLILSLGEPGGDRLVQATAYARTAPAGSDTEIRKERDEMRAENAALKSTNTRLTEANQRMERYIETDRAEHQRKRLENQSSDGK
jgi:Prokaryotic homologs of the JAB domain